MYGILLRMGGPNSLRPSDRVFKPPRSTVPPSGTLTVVATVIVVMLGCWKNIWKRPSGGPVVLRLPGPNRDRGTGNCTGNKGTAAEVRLVIVGTMFRRTKRRSADITGVTRSVTPSGNGELLGVKIRL